MKYVFLTACRNEERILGEFLEEFTAMVTKADIAGRAVLYVVDDLSMDRSVAILEKYRETETGVRLEIIHAPTNLGNQGALYYGLGHIDVDPEDQLITFDCDGEDDVAQIPSILELGRDNPGKLVLIERGRRAESLVFRTAFVCYKAMFRFLTRQTVIPNNFLLIPCQFVPKIRRLPLAPVHFAYAIMKLGLASVTTRRDRRPRYGGHSSQNVFTVGSHGLVGLMVFYENVIAKLLVLLSFFGVSAVAVIGGALAVRYNVGIQRTLLWVAVAAAGVAVGLFGLLLSAGMALLFKVTVFTLSRSADEARTRPTPQRDSGALAPGVAPAETAGKKAS